MPGLHWPDLIIVLVIALLVFGPKKLPEMGSSIGKGIREFRKGMSELSQPKEDDEEEDLDSSMTLVEHLEELRWRILKSIIAIAVGAIIAFIFRVPILTLLELPLPKMAADSLTHGKPVVTGITEGFTVFLLISVA